MKQLSSHDTFGPAYGDCCRRLSWALKEKLRTMYQGIRRYGAKCGL